MGTKIVQTERITKFYLSFSEVQPIFEAAKQAQVMNKRAEAKQKTILFK